MILSSPVAFGCIIRGGGGKKWATAIGYVDTVPGCVDRVRPVGGGRKLRGRGQRDERVYDGVWSSHVDNWMADHVRPAYTRHV